MLGKVSRPRNLLKWTRERQGRSGSEREPPLRALHGRKWPTSDWSFEKARQQWEGASLTSPSVEGTHPIYDLPPLDWRGREFSSGLDLGAFTCLLCHVTLAGTNASALKLHFASLALTPQVGVSCPPRMFTAKLS